MTIELSRYDGGEWSLWAEEGGWRGTSMDIEEAVAMEIFQQLALGRHAEQGVEGCEKCLVLVSPYGRMRVWDCGGAVSGSSGIGMMWEFLEAFIKRS